MKAITLLASTGSIGTQTLDIVAQYPDQFLVPYPGNHGKHVARVAINKKEVLEFLGVSSRLTNYMQRGKLSVQYEKGKNGCFQ